MLKLVCQFSDRFCRGLAGAAIALAASGTAIGEDRSGEALYKEHCASCHGEQGLGDLGLPLNQTEFLRLADREYLVETMKHGRPGRVMPSFEHLLTSEQREKIAEHVLAWRDGDPLSRPTVAAGNAEEGARLYQERCADCHGYKGQGGDRDKPRAGHISGEEAIVPPALNNSGFLAAADDAFIKAVLMQGQQGDHAPRPKWEELNSQQMDDLVAYIRSWKTGVEPLAKPVIEVHSDLPPADLVPLLKMAIKSHNFAFIDHQTLYEDLPGGKAEEPVHILHFCRFGMLHKAVQEEKRVGTFLPCQITVSRREGHTVMSAINPKALSPLFHNPEIELHCSLVSKKYLAIMREANF